MGTTITREVVRGTDIDPSLSGLYIEKDAVPAVQEFLRNAVGEEDCLIGRMVCWNYRSAEEAKTKAASLLQKVNHLCTPDFFLSQKSPIVSRSSIESTLYFIRKYSEGGTYSASEVEDIGLDIYWRTSEYDKDFNTPRPGLCSHTHFFQTCENEKDGVFTGRLVCKVPSTY
jgi:hypothetical protein